MRFLRWVVCAVISAALGFFFASILHTQSVLAKLSEINVTIPIAERFSATWHDLLGMAPSYGLVILVALILAFSITDFINRKLKISSHILYPIAGGVGFLVMLLAMQPLLNVTLIAGARGAMGFSLQVFAGVVAGMCFASLRKQNVPSLGSQ